MNGSVEYRALNVGFIPTNVADRMPAGKSLIALPLPDIQLENPRGVGKGRVLINI
jgi:hypothetical protein